MYWTSSPPGVAGGEALVPGDGLSVLWGFQDGGRELGPPGSWNAWTSTAQRDGYRVGFLGGKT